MAKEFQEQGGAATMDPNRVLRWLTSRVMSIVSQSSRLANKHYKLEQKRIKTGARHVVEYFHQVDDGYSHLAAQILEPLAQRYDIDLQCHLVSGPPGKNSAEPELLLQLSRYDSWQVAEAYGLEFEQHAAEPEASLVQLASRILAAQSSAEFASCAAQVGRALWSDDREALQRLAQELGCASEEKLGIRMEEGNSRREALSHYSGAMFFYGEEWYWGVDRLYHLERRLNENGADRNSAATALIPRPNFELGATKDNGTMTLEIFPSLRSPYTAISFDRAVKLARDTGVKLSVRPVLPMVMRGVPATRQKGMYIFADTAREAHAAGVPFGNFYDPIGEPVRRGYSLYPWACEQGKGTELISAFLGCAFAQGVNLNTDKGLQKVVEKAGLDWSQAKSIVGNSDWQEQLEVNRLAMYDSGLWGVPSFRLLDENGKELLSLWGQDRLWLFSQEIQRQIAGR
ncbi:MAG: 2-hydroxychromene-2-carboxylate isomerase [Halioglobus sp.]|jgi:2-hydroxychromene-2-carboxylate isomerase